MTETKNDGEKILDPQNGKEAGNPGKTIPFPSNGKEKEIAGQTNPGNASEKINPTIGIDKEQTFLEVRIPFAIGLWNGIGFIYEIVIPTIRKIHLEKAQKSALKNKLISPPPGFRGFNPRQWFKK